MEFRQRLRGSPQFLICWRLNLGPSRNEAIVFEILRECLVILVAIVILAYLGIQVFRGDPVDTGLLGLLGLILAPLLRVKKKTKEPDD